jgi:hypothetical protein
MYCKTGPAIGPVGRRHIHSVNCTTAPGGASGRGHTHALALAGCCASCDHGGTCESKLGEFDVKKTAHVAFMVAGAVCLGLWLTKPKKKRR